MQAIRWHPDKNPEQSELAQKKFQDVAEVGGGRSACVFKTLLAFTCRRPLVLGKKGKQCLARGEPCTAK